MSFMSIFSFISVVFLVLVRIMHAKFLAVSGSSFRGLLQVTRVGLEDGIVFEQSGCGMKYLLGMLLQVKESSSSDMLLRTKEEIHKLACCCGQGDKLINWHIV